MGWDTLLLGILFWICPKLNAEMVGWWDGGTVGWWDGGMVGWWDGGMVGWPSSKPFTVQFWPLWPMDIEKTWDQARWKQRCPFVPHKTSGVKCLSAVCPSLTSKLVQSCPLVRKLNSQSQRFSYLDIVLWLVVSNPDCPSGYETVMQEAAHTIIQFHSLVIPPDTYSRTLVLCIVDILV